MEMFIDWNAVIAGAMVLGLGGFGWIGRTIVSTLAKIHVDIRELTIVVDMNSREVRQWQTLHGELDDRQFASLHDAMKSNNESYLSRIDQLSSNVDRLEQRVDVIQQR